MNLKRHEERVSSLRRFWMEWDLSDAKPEDPIAELGGLKREMAAATTQRR